MSAKITDILNGLGTKLQLMLTKYKSVKEERDNALQRCAELEARNLKLAHALQEANTEIEYLRISHKVASTPDDVLRSRILLTELVKKIDKCISQLRQD